MKHPATTQAALGKPKTGGGTEQRWANTAVQAAIVCAVDDEAHAARVKLLSDPRGELDPVPIARDISPVIGEHVLVAWLHGHVHNPVIVAVLDIRSLEESIATKRPMADLVPPAGGKGQLGRHVHEYPLQVVMPTARATDAYASMTNWEAHDSDGAYRRVHAQELPSPQTAAEGTPPQFQKLYRESVVDPSQLESHEQHPVRDGSAAWRVATVVSESGDLELRIQHGGYRAGSVQDWEGDDDATLTLGLEASGKLTISRGELTLTYDDAAGNLTVHADRITRESSNVRLGDENRPVLVREPGASLPPGITEATELQV